MLDRYKSIFLLSPPTGLVPLVQDEAVGVEIGLLFLLEHLFCRHGRYLSKTKSEHKYEHCNHGQNANDNEWDKFAQSVIRVHSHVDYLVNGTLPAIVHKYLELEGVSLPILRDPQNRTVSFNKGDPRWDSATLFIWH